MGAWGRLETAGPTEPGTFLCGTADASPLENPSVPAHLNSRTGSAELFVLPKGTDL